LVILAQTEEAETVKEVVEEVIPSVPVSSDPEKRTCPVCHEDFEEFYNQARRYYICF